MSKAPHLRLTQVDPVDDLAPIPISSASQMLRPRTRDPRFDSIRMAEEAMNRVERDFGRLKILLDEEFTDPDGPPHRAA